MNRRLTRGEIFALLGCLALIAVIAATGMPGRQKVWANLGLDGMQAQTELRLDAGDAYGEYGGGPYLDLPAGTYRLRWRISGDGANAIRLSCSNGVEIAPERLSTDPAVWEDEAVFTLPEAVHSFSIHICFCDGTYLRMDDLRLYSPVYTDRAWAAALLLLGAWLLAVIWRRLDAQGRQALALLALAAVFTSLPVLREDAVLSIDTQFHAARIMNLADGLRSGQLPVRVGGFSYNGYGAATSVFYPDALLVPLALMVLGGASITFVLQLFTVLVNGLTAALMYASARRMPGSREAALCASLLYVCSVYRLRGLYETFMMGQVLAMAVLPLFLLGLWEVCRGEAKRWPLLSAGATLIVQSHMLTTLLCALLALCAVLLCLPAMLRERRLPALLKAAGMTLLLNLWTLVPMVTLCLSGVNTGTMQFGFSGSALELHEVLQPDGFIGLPLLLGAALLAGTKAPADGRAARLCAVFGAGAVLLSTKLFPWSYAVRLTGGLIEVLQFPWRFLTLAVPLLAFAAGCVYASGREGTRMAAAVLALSMLCAGPYVGQVVREGEQMRFGEGTNPYMILPEYQIEGTDVGDTRSRTLLVEGDAQVTAYEKEGTRISCAVSAQSDAVLTLPLFGFAGYEATLDGEPLAVGLGENNRLTVRLPAGAQGTLRVRFVNWPLWRVCDAVSLLTLMAAVAAWVMRRRKRMRVMQSDSSCAR